MCYQATSKRRCGNVNYVSLTDIDVMFSAQLIILKCLNDSNYAILVIANVESNLCIVPVGIRTHTCCLWLSDVNRHRGVTGRTRPTLMDVMWNGGTTHS